MTTAICPECHQEVYLFGGRVSVHSPPRTTIVICPGSGHVVDELAARQTPMFDREFLARAVEGGVLCPSCRHGWLQMGEGGREASGLGTFQGLLAPGNRRGAYCPICVVCYATFRELFLSIASAQRWKFDTWDYWRKAHPEYAG